MRLLTGLIVVSDIPRVSFGRSLLSRERAAVRRSLRALTRTRQRRLGKCQVAWTLGKKWR